MQATKEEIKNEPKLKTCLRLTPLFFLSFPFFHRAIDAFVLIGSLLIKR